MLQCSEEALRYKRALPKPPITPQGDATSPALAYALRAWLFMAFGAGAGGRAVDRAGDRAVDRAVDRAGDRAVDRAVDRAAHLAHNAHWPRGRLLPGACRRGID